MKTLLSYRFILASSVLILLLSASALAQITKDERKNAVDHLKASHKALKEAIKGLTSSQLNFKPSNDIWSIAECVEHIAITEATIFGMVNMALTNEATDVETLPDEQVLGIIESRDQKVKTRPEAEPTEKFGKSDGSLEEFERLRKSNIEYVRATEDDLRAGYVELPFGWIDAYQVILFMSGHTNRHVAQIEEIKAHSEYPM